MRRVQIDLAGDKGEVSRRRVFDDRPFDAVEIRPALLPVIRILRHPDHFVRLELDEFEGPGADRAAAHVARRYVTGIDRRPAGGEQCEQSRLRPLQSEGNLVVAIRGHLFDIAVPGFARIDAKLLARLAAQQVPGAFHVLGGEGFAVMPFDTVPQRESQLGALLVRGPAGGQIWDDRPHAVLRHVLIVHDEIIEDPHHWPQRRSRRLLEERHARRAVEMGDFENSARFLSDCRVCDKQRKRQRTRCREHARTCLHPINLLFEDAGPKNPPLRRCGPVYWAHLQQRSNRRLSHVRLSTNESNPG